MGIVTKVRSGRIGLIAAGVALSILLIASKVHADDQGFHMIKQSDTFPCLRAS